MYSKNSFERYANDIIIHGNSKEESELLLKNGKARMQQYGLVLHPEKTKVVYGKNYQRPGKHDNDSLTFLSYSLQPNSER